MKHLRDHLEKLELSDLRLERNVALSLLDGFVIQLGFLGLTTATYDMHNL